MYRTYCNSVEKSVYIQTLGAYGTEFSLLKAEQKFAVYFLRYPLVVGSSLPARNFGKRTDSHSPVVAM